MSDLRPVRALLIAVFMLMAGSGFLATRIALLLRDAGVGPGMIGLVATCYFAGLALGSLLCLRLVRRVGHIRAFAAFASLYSATTLTYAMVQHPGLWAGLRLVDGLCMSGIFVCLESWLNERAPPAGRGRILAIYMIALYVGQAVGQPILNLSDTQPLLPFIVGSALLSLAVLPVALTRMPAPALSEGSAMGVRQLYAASPLGVAGAFANGVMLGAFYGLGGLFAAGIGLDLAGTSLFMSAAILGGVILQWPLGILSDRYDRRLVIAGTLAATLLLSLAIILATLEAGTGLLIVVALFGGTTFACYPLCVAHTNDRLASDQRTGASGGLVLTYSVGAALGPLAGSGSMAMAGPTGLFWLFALIAGLCLAFAWRRMQVTEPVPDAQQLPYQVLPRTTPVAATMDPRSPNGG